MRVAGRITGVMAGYVPGRRAASNLRSSGRIEDRGLMVGSFPGPMLRMSRGAACFAAGGPACGGDAILAALTRRETGEQSHPSMGACTNIS
jgi:hypothetical protein